MVRVCGMEPSTVSGFSAEGSALDAEPSMMQSVFVDGSPNSFAQTPEIGDTATVGCGQGLRTERPGQATICTSSDAYGQKTEEAANRHYSGLQPQ